MILVVLLNSCADTNIGETKRNRGPLISQILTFRSDYPNSLTNRDDFGIVSYDLNDLSVRKMLDSMYFSCQVNGKWYAICQDRPGLCRETLECVKWKDKIFKKDVCLEYKQEFLDTQKDLTMLVESVAICFSEKYW